MKKSLSDHYQLFAITCIKPHFIINGFVWLFILN